MMHLWFRFGIEGKIGKLMKRQDLYLYFFIDWLPVLLSLNTFFKNKKPNHFYSGMVDSVGCNQAKVINSVP
jgi:hypothetical protein